MTTPRRLPPTLLLILLFPGGSCAPIPASGPDSTPATSLASTVLADFSGPPIELLDAMRGKVRGMIVQESETGCPRIHFRGMRSLQGENDPLVYVGGARATNTCVLTSLSTADVARVETYSSGVAPRPPYQAHPNGLIIVYLHQRAS